MQKKSVNQVRTNARALPEKPQPYVNIEPGPAKLMAPRCGLGPAGLIIPRQQAMMYGYSGPGLSPDHL